MSAARRLALFRAALCAFVFTTVLVVCIALPTILQAADPAHWAPTRDATFTAVGILLVWWGSAVAALYADRR